MAPGSPAFATGPTPEQAAPRAAEVCSRWRACTRLLQLCSGRSEPKAASSPDASPPGRPGTARPGTRTRARRRSPGSTTEGRSSSRSDNPACHAVAVATVGLAAAPARLCRFPSGRLWRTGRPGAFPNGGTRRAARSSSATRASRSARRASRSPSGRQLPELRCWLEKPAKLSDLSDQLLVGVGFSAEDVMRRRIPNNTSGLLRWWTPLSKYEMATCPKCQRAEGTDQTRDHE